jgi:hypothetical protein
MDAYLGGRSEAYCMPKAESNASAQGNISSRLLRRTMAIQSGAMLSKKSKIEQLPKSRGTELIARHGGVREARTLRPGENPRNETISGGSRIDDPGLLPALYVAGSGRARLPDPVIARIIGVGASEGGEGAPWKLSQWRRGSCC